MHNGSVYFSVKLRRNLAEQTERVPPGAAHYSYSTVAEKFVTVLKRHGCIPYELERPEIYVKSPLEADKKSIHIVFKPFDEIRVLRGAFNIAHVAWEFDKLPRRPDWLIGDERRCNPFSDYCHMLQLPDMVWVGCDYTKGVLERFGISKIDIVPAPIEVMATSRRDCQGMRRVGTQAARRQLSRIKVIKLDRSLCANPDEMIIQAKQHDLSSIFRQDRSIFLSVANPGDLRKNLPALIDGFSFGAQAKPSVFLIIKLVIDNQHVTLRTVIRDLLPQQYRYFERSMGDVTPTNIVLLPQFLTKAEMQALYFCAEFYISASVAEGQNLPLQEAMAVGTIPVAARHTAMADYVTPDNGVLIQWNWAPAPLCFERAYGLRDFRLPCIDPENIASAVVAAGNLSGEDRLRKREASWETIASKYSQQVLGPQVIRRLEAYLR